MAWLEQFCSTSVRADPPPGSWAVGGLKANWVTATPSVHAVVVAAVAALGANIATMGTITMAAAANRSLRNIESLSSLALWSPAGGLARAAVQAGPGAVGVTVNRG